jgi:hypothetical protein
MRRFFTRRPGLEPGADRRGGACVFVTWRLDPGQRPLTPVERGLVCDVLRRGHGDRYVLRAFVVMDDHVHVLVQPARDTIARVVHSWKAFAAHQLERAYRRSGRVWGQDSTLLPVETQQELRQRLECIAGNPWKRWPFVKAYPWVWEVETEEPGG